MGTTTVSAPRLLLGRTLSGPGAVVVEDGRVVDVLTHRPPPGPSHVAFEDGVLSPGLVDLQVNGAFGVDLADATREGWDLVTGRLPRTGVTAFLPTFVTATAEDTAAALDRVASAVAAPDHGPGPGGPAARVLGAHLEGPFLSPDRAGAHDRSLMRVPDRAALDALLGAPGAHALRMVTLAPELPHALEAIGRLSAAGVVVSVGHSDATGEQTRAAADAGARMVTHLFNAQRGLGHREPGVAGAALADPRFALGLVADLHHVDPTVLRVVVAAAVDRVVLVTDATAAMGMPPGRYTLGGRTVVVDPSTMLPRLEDGTVAGSSLRLDAAVRNLVQAGAQAGAALAAASLVPADVLGRPDLGRLEPGARADLVWWDDDLVPHRTWVGGVEVPA